MKRLSTYMAIIAVLILSCNSAGNDRNKNIVADVALVSPQEAPAYKPKSEAAGQIAAPAPQPQKEPTTHEDWDKKIIKTAEVSLELKDYAGYNQSIHKGLKSYGAYIATEEQSLNDDRNTNSITIKVPVEQFENLMNSFSGEGIKVLQKKISSEDVTGEVVDTKSRMEAKKQMRERYLELLKQAKNMKEILEVQNEINSIQEDIESASGRVSYLNHQSAYSTIHLQYFQYLDPTNSTKQPPGYFAKLAESFTNGFHILGGLFILLVSIWPLILGGIILFMIVWKKRKMKILKA